MSKIYNELVFNNIRESLITELSESRYKHTIGVEYTAASLAMKYQYNIEKARMAGLLHDCAKNISDDNLLQLCIADNIEIKEIEKTCKYLLHSKYGAFLAKSKYGIDDEDILNAIYYHTIGRPHMSILEKIVFVADYIEPGRDKAKNLEIIRKVAFEDIDLAIYMILRDTIEYLNNTVSFIDSDTLKTYEFYKQGGNTHE